MLHRAPSAPTARRSAGGGFVFTAGQVGLDPATGELVAGGVAAQAEQAMRNLAAVLDAAGTGLDRVVKTTIFLVDLADFAAVNEVYASFLTRAVPGALDGRGAGPAQGRAGRDRMRSRSPGKAMSRAGCRSRG